MYQDGRVCISILHTPGDDPLGYETAAERWSPVQSIEKILLSVVSMLAGEPTSLWHNPPLCVFSEPNDESGANVDASVSWWLTVYTMFLIIVFPSENVERQQTAVQWDSSDISTEIFRFWMILYVCVSVLNSFVLTSPCLDSTPLNKLRRPGSRQQQPSK